MNRPIGTDVGTVQDEDEDLADEAVVDLVRDVVNLVGGIDAFVRPGDRVLIKPNQTLWFTAVDGVTSDPRVVAALVTLALEADAEQVVVGDGCGGDLQSARVLEVTGIQRFAEKAGAEVVGFEDRPHRDVVVQVDGEPLSVPVPDVVLDADCVINVPKAKTHFEDPISCCIKNWVGVIGQSDRPRFMVDPLLYKVTAGLMAVVPARLHVVDALWVGEGDGPAANDGRWMGCLFAGRDPVALDRLVADAMGLEGRRLRFAEAGAAIGLGTLDRADVRVHGRPLSEVRMPVRPTRMGFSHLPIRTIQGEGVTWAGTLGHLKSIADVFDKFGMWTAVQTLYGRPTFMIGEADDPDFEAHLEEGPYFVLDDAARPRYKNDPRVTFIPGHPATHNIFPAIFDRLHVEHVGPMALKLASVQKQLASWFHLRSWSARAPVQKQDDK